MAKLIMTKGLPASGKSTWAKDQANRSQGLTKIVCKDDLRAMLDNGQWSKSREKFIESAQAMLIKLALDSGYTVIAADTNLAPRQQERLENIAKEKGVQFEVKDFTDVPIEECIKRDQKRPNYVGEQVIKRMYYEHLAPKPQPRVIDPDKEDAYIFDIDGTLADLNGRNPYDASTCENDLVREHLLHVFNGLPSRCYRIIMSGREDKYREQTESWLKSNGFGGWDYVLMRATDDNRKDSIIKRELFERHVEPKFNVLGIFDDRPQVIRMWESLGLPVFNVGNGVEF